jgi:hypothetical protein
MVGIAEANHPAFACERAGFFSSDVSGMREMGIKTRVDVTGLLRALTAGDDEALSAACVDPFITS